MVSANIPESVMNVEIFFALSVSRTCQCPVRSQKAGLCNRRARVTGTQLGFEIVFTVRYPTKPGVLSAYSPSKHGKAQLGDVGQFHSQA